MTFMLENISLVNLDVGLCATWPVPSPYQFVPVAGWPKSSLVSLTTERYQ